MSTTPRVRFKRLRPGALVPRYMSAGAAGLDLASAADEAITLAPGARTAVPTGLAFAIPQGFEGQVRPRSGLARKHGITLTNSPGTIDSDYRGEVKVLLANLGERPFTVARGERIAQLVVARCERVALVEAPAASPTRRGAGGFGSTGRAVAVRRKGKT